MSTVPEAIVAAQMRVPALGISLVTNHAAGVARQPLAHAEVLASGARAAARSRTGSSGSSPSWWLRRAARSVADAAPEPPEERECRARPRGLSSKTARAMRGSAYAPYSGYAVGAALLGTNGRVYTGCNVENASYGLTVCAERAAYLPGRRRRVPELRALAVATEDGGPPCGACLQVAREFGARASTVAARGAVGRAREPTLAELLPTPVPALRTSGRRQSETVALTAGDRPR